LEANNPLPEDLNHKVRELESEVNELKAQIEALTKFAKAHSEHSVMTIGHVLEGMSILRYYANQTQVRIDDIDGTFESIGELQHIYESCNFLGVRDQIENYAANLMSCILELCGEAGISSRELLETLKKRFDRETLLRIVNLDDVADSYGIAEAHTWWHILHE
jgi:hypothetical protein